MSIKACRNCDRLLLRLVLSLCASFLFDVLLRLIVESRGLIMTSVEWNRVKLKKPNPPVDKNVKGG